MAIDWWIMDTKEWEQGKCDNNKNLIEYYSYKICISGEIKHIRSEGKECTLISIQNTSIK